MSQPFKLYRLQQFDSQIDSARARLRGIQAEINNATQLQAAQDQFTQTERDFSAARKKLKHSEELVTAQRIKIEQTEASLYGGKVRNPKELQDLQNESASLKRYLVTLEDRQLEDMLTFEESEQKYKDAKSTFERIEAEHRTRVERLTQESRKVDMEIVDLDVERKAVALGIPDADIRLYEQLRVIRRGVAVAKVNNKTCGACGSTLSAALLQAAYSPNQLARCESCNRILYAG